MAAGKVVLVGPVLPYRGGIAQHTTMLHRALVERGAGFTLSFTRQYPRFLFPGEDDRDPAYADHSEPGVEYLIDSVNPLTWRKAVKRLVASGATTVVFPWWHVYWSFCFGYMSWALRRRGLEVVFFCHNVVEHESAAWKSVLTRWVLKHADRCVVHTREDEANLLQLIPDVKIAVHPHPIYDQFPPALGRLPRRANLELLFYGFVRPYKGLDVLIEAMAEVKGDVMLTVAGEFWKGEESVRERIEELGLGDRIELRPHYHTDEETAELFSRADVVVLPYRSATGSGVVPIAYHYEKPVIATRVGGLPDVIIEDETGWLVEPESPQALAKVIGQLSRQRVLACQPGIQKMKAGMTWASLAEQFKGGDT